MSIRGKLTALFNRAKEKVFGAARNTGDLREKAGEMAAKAATAATRGVDAAASGVDKATGGKHTDKIKRAAHRVASALDRSRPRS